MNPRIFVVSAMLAAALATLLTACGPSPEQLARDYSDLIEFSRRILTERREHLEKRAVELREEIKQLDATNLALTERRRTALQILGGTVSLQKYKDLQRQLDQDRANRGSTLPLDRLPIGRLSNARVDRPSGRRSTS